MGATFIAKFQRPVSIGVLALLCGWFIYLAVQNVFFYIDASVVMDLENIDSAPASQPQQQGQSSPNPTTLALFGRPDANASTKVIEAPTTRLNLELQGVFLSDTNGSSSAIVAERGRDGKLYIVGDKLPGNGVLQSVAADHILFKRSGRLEKLMFTSKRLDIQASGSSPSNDVARASQNRRTPTEDERANSVTRRSPAAATTTGTRLSDIQTRLAQNPKAVLDEYGLSAVAPGTSQGYKINSAHPALANSGLQPGDRVVSVNGAPLGVAMNDVRLIDQARSAGRVRVEVERGGRRFFLTIPIP